MYGTGIPNPYQLFGQGVNALGQGINSLYNQVTQGQEPRGNQPPKRSLRQGYGLPTQTKMVDGIPIDVQPNDPNYPSMYQPGRIYGDPRAFDPQNDPRYPSMYQPGRIYGDPEAFDDPQRGAAIQEDGAPRMSNQETRQQERPIPTQEELAERDYQNRAVNMAQQKDPYMVGAAALNSTDPAIAMQINKALYGMNYAVPSTPNPMLAGMMPPPGPRDNEQSMAQKMQIGIGNPDAARMGNIPFGMQEGSLMDEQAANEFLAKYKFFEPR